MKNKVKLTLWVLLLLQPVTVYAWGWTDIWQTADQQAAKLLQAGKPEQAARTFKNKDWQAVAQYRSGNYAQSYRQFQARNTSDSQYNAGNAAAFQEHYQEAIAAYDKALALNPNNTDAFTNREIVKKLQKQTKQPQDKSSDRSKDDKKDQTQGKDNQSSSQNSKQDNATANDNKQNQETRSQKDAKDKAGEQPQQGNKEKEKENNQTAGGQQPASGQQDQTNAATNRVQAGNEDKRQLLRRVADDPGGLLRQKFMRDYLRRHAEGDSADQGVS
jgi:Ca-activated chloride channel family protein